VDERPELDEIYTTVTSISEQTIPPSGTTGVSPALSSGLTRTVSLDDPVSISDHVTWSPQSLYSEPQLRSPIKRRRTNESRASIHSYHSQDQGHDPGLLLYRVESAPTSGQPLDHETSIESLLRAADLADHGFNESAILDSSINDNLNSYENIGQSPQSWWPDLDVQEACLLRYFVDDLACWVCPIPLTATKVLTLMLCSV
jgi:hypothetical protein